jgi:hypothetical protein
MANINIDKILGVVKSNPKLFIEFITDIATHPTAATDLVKVKDGTMTPMAFVQAHEDVLLTALEQFAAVVTTNPELFSALVEAISGGV